MIDKNTYVLPQKNYVHKITNKRFIIIGSTFNTNMRHYIGWLTRYNGQYKKTAAFTIDFAGNIYQHFDPKYYANISNDMTLNSQSILILLENEGWLQHDAKKEKFINWIGDIYKRNDVVFEKKWRNYVYWAPYTKEQMISAIELCRMLCDEFGIIKAAMPTNTKEEDFDDFEGVLYKSTLDANTTEINPSWDCMDFKNKLENKLIKNEY